MGAANVKANDAGSSRETNVIECIPVCLGCSPICEPKNIGTEPEDVKNKWTKSGSFRAGSFGKTTARNKAADINPDQRKVQTGQIEPEDVKNKWRKSGSFRDGSFGKTHARNKAADINPDQRDVKTPESVGSSQSTYLPTSSNQPLQRSRSADVLAPVQRPVIQSSLSFKGTIPPDWDKKQQEQLQWAITEVSRRSKTRAPGARAMQGQVAARFRELRGDRITGDYNKK